LRERISLGHLFMIASALLAFGLVVSLLQDRTATVRVLVADREILPGAPVTPDLVREVTVPADSDLVGSLATINALGGTPTASQRIAAGDPITVTALAPSGSPSGLRAMSLPIDRIDAVGGDLAPGDRVDVIATTGGTARYVAVDLEVLATQVDESTGGLTNSGVLSNYYITVSVDDQTALELALALDTAEVSVLRSTGANPVATGGEELVPPGADPAATDPAATEPSETEPSETDSSDADESSDEGSPGG
jgi:Flp pilus assembly protein CpaB